MNENSELDHAIEKRNKVYYLFCDKLITLSTGALALSITFRNSIVPSSPKYLWLLSASWFFFALTILAALAVHWGETWIWNRRANEVLKDDTSDGKLPKRFAVSRWIMFSAFVVAILCFVLFAIVNIYK